jgi:hypothetical protein
VALWLIDHQMNVRVSEEFGLYFARIAFLFDLYRKYTSLLPAPAGPKRRSK